MQNRRKNKASKPNGIVSFNMFIVRVLTYIEFAMEICSGPCGLVLDNWIYFDMPFSVIFQF